MMIKVNYINLWVSLRGSENLCMWVVRRPTDFCILESDVSGADQAEDPEGDINTPSQDAELAAIAVVAVSVAKTAKRLCDGSWRISERTLI